MHQLLEYGIKLASEKGLDPQSLLKDAEVMSIVEFVVILRFSYSSLAACSRTEINPTVKHLTPFIFFRLGHWTSISSSSFTTILPAIHLAT